MKKALAKARALWHNEVIEAKHTNGVNYELLN
ncbi:hypothetical protein [Citrobacter phage Ci1]|nr:hypothetical protein [Citrobacter phage Ci1]